MDYVKGAVIKISLTFSWRRPLSNRDQSIDLQNWFLYDNGLRHERVKEAQSFYVIKVVFMWILC